LGLGIEIRAFLESNRKRAQRWEKPDQDGVRSRVRPNPMRPTNIIANQSAMNPSKVDRSRTILLTDLPNVGPSIAEDLRAIGIQAPGDLVGKDPVELYDRLNEITGTQHDPCVLDVFLSVTDFMNGNAAQPWWAYTQERKNRS
jgi:hypothetical protein